MGIHAVIIYFCFVLIDLHNGLYVDCYWYKKWCFLRFVIFEKGMSKKLRQVF